MCRAAVSAERAMQENVRARLAWRKVIVNVLSFGDFQATAISIAITQ